MLGVLVAMALAIAGCAPGAPEAMHVAEAEAVLRPDGLAERSGRVALRHRWDSAFPGRGGSAVYRFRVPSSADGMPRAMLIERVGNQAEVEVDGATVRRLAAGDRSDAGRRAHMADLPPGAADVTVRVTLQALRGGGLSPVLVGPREAMQARYEWRRLMDQELPAAYAACLLLVGGLTAGLWWRQRDPLYGCFSLMACFGSVRQVDRLWLEAPLGWPLWGAILAIAYGCQLVLIARFVVLVAGSNPRWLVRAIHGVAVATVLLAGLSFAASEPRYWTAALVLVEVLGLACFAVVARDALAQRRWAIWTVLGAGTLLLAAGLHDLLFVRMAIAGLAVREPLAPHALFFFVLAMSGIVVDRYNASVAALHVLNRDLHRRVAEREAQLTQAFEALRQQREEQAAAAERQRIMRDIHDGVGSQLVGVMSLVRQPEPDTLQIRQHVESALDELRMAVDSMQPVHGDLTTVLATLRYRLQPRLRAAGIEIVWDVAALPPLQNLSPQSVLQVQRILLESFTNILRHAQATSVTVSARHVGSHASGPHVQLAVIDNGIGIADAAVSQGQGLANIRARAAAIGAVVEIAAVPGGGTRVGLTWPAPLSADDPVAADVPAG
jgi:signal transduction histidine kinase